MDTATPSAYQGYCANNGTYITDVYPVTLEIRVIQCRRGMATELFSLILCKSCKDDIATKDILIHDDEDRLESVCNAITVKSCVSCGFRKTNKVEIKFDEHDDRHLVLDLCNECEGYAPSMINKIDLSEKDATDLVVRDINKKWSEEN